MFARDERKVRQPVNRRRRAAAAANQPWVGNRPDAVVSSDLDVTTRLDFGELKRFQPLCGKWGTSRGGAVDRYYIDRFVQDELAATSGHYLECGGRRYHSLLRADQLRAYDCVDIDPAVPGVTVRADLHDLGEIESDSIDVAICTQTLQYARNPACCVGELRRVLRPGGKLILTVPFLEHDYRRMGDLTRFTVKSVEDLLSGFSARSVSGAGNLWTSICFLMGLGLDDVTQEDLERPGDFYHVVLARARK